MDPTDFNWFTLYPCAMSFFQRLCSAPFPPVSCSFLSPIQTHKVASTIFWRDNQKIVGLGREILYNIQPPNPTQYWSHWRPWGRPNSCPGVPGGHHTLTCLGIWSSKGCHTSTCSGICQSQGSQEVITPRPAQGPNSREAVTPRPARGFDL